MTSFQYTLALVHFGRCPGTEGQVKLRAAAFQQRIQDEEAKRCVGRETLEGDALRIVSWMELCPKLSITW